MDNLQNSLQDTFIRNKSKNQNLLREQNMFFDLFLKCSDGSEIGVHKIIISSASDYFKNCLTMTPMKENDQKYIQLPGGITGDILEKIITFIYTNEFNKEIADAEQILKYAVLYQLHELEEICTIILSSNLTEKKCFSYWRLATDNLAYNLKLKCIEFIRENFENLHENSFLNSLTLDEVKILIADDRLQCTEEKVFDFVWNWCSSQTKDNYKTKRFYRLLNKLIHLIRFSALSNDYVLSKILYNKNLLRNINAEKIAEFTARKIQNKNVVPSCLIFTESTRSRYGSRMKQFFAISAMGSELTTFEKFSEYEFATVKNKQFNDGFGHTIFQNNFLLICGGNNSTNCEYLEPINMEWNYFPSMNFKRTAHSCAFIDNEIFVCGGQESKNTEVFNLGSGQWINGPEMMETRESFALSAINGAIYAFGGGRTTVEILDPRTSTWTSVKENNFPTFGYTQSVLGKLSEIYCFHNGKMHVLDTRMNRYTTEIIDYKDEDLDSNFSVCFLDGYIYFFKSKVEYGKCFSYFSKYDCNGKEYYKNKINECLTNRTEIVGTSAIVALYY